TAVAAGLGYAAYRTSVGAAQAHVLLVDRIVVHGNERLSDADVIAVVNGLRGESMMWTDLETWRDRLIASPWVRDASLRRGTPSGIGRINSELYLIDESGVLIDEYGPHFADFDLPIVDGLPAGTGGVG